MADLTITKLNEGVESETIDIYEALRRKIIENQESIDRLHSRIDYLQSRLDSMMDMMRSFNDIRYQLDSLTDLVNSKL